MTTWCPASVCSVCGLPVNLYAVSDGTSITPYTGAMCPGHAPRLPMEPPCLTCGGTGQCGSCGGRGTRG